MHRFKALGLALVAVLVAVAAVGAVYASATTMTLPTFSVQQSFTGSSGAGKLTSSGLTISCKSGTNEGTMESNRNLGLFTIEFKKCETSLTTEKCHSLGNGSVENILVSGSWHLVLETLSSGDMHYLLLLLNPLHIECGTVLISVRGNVLGLIEPINTSTKEFKLIVNSNETSTQEYTSFENNNGTLVETKLEAETAGLGFKKAGETSAENKIFVKTASEIQN